MPNFRWDVPENYYFGGGGDTFATPLALVVLVIASALILALPRKYVIVPFLLAGLLVPLNVSVVIASLNFNANRLLLLAGWIRLLARGEQHPHRLSLLDKALFYFALANSIAYCLVWRDFGALVNRLGYLWSVLGAYFLLRSLIREKEDIIRAIKVLAVVVTVIAPLMLYEHQTRYNFFSLVGASEYSMVRNAAVRAKGPFAHAIIAGTIGSVMLPLFLALWQRGAGGRLLAASGAVSVTIMALTSSSSTPLSSYAAGIIALVMWPLRKRMREVRWSIVGLLACIQLVMTAPIWHLPTRLAGLMGGSGWHRSMLMENFVLHFFDWWLIGTNDNANWGWSMWDVDNAFVGAGLTGGLASFILFLCVFVCAYRAIGVARKLTEKSGRDAGLVWGLGACLFANTVGFFGIVYFDQSIIVWYALLVMIQVAATCVAGERQLQRQSLATRSHAQRFSAEPI